MKLFLIPILLAMGMGMAACVGDPASGGSVAYDPNVHGLEKIDLEGAKTLVLSPADIPASSAAFYVKTKPSCDDLGKLDGAIYSKLETQSNGKGPVNPCFKNVGFWKDGAIFGQYTPEDSTQDVWFVTDSEGNVHHLRGTPRGGRDFKNGKRIKLFREKPVYLNEENQLIFFDMSTDEEEIITDSGIDRFVILHRQDGEHLVYKDEDGAGKRIKPSDETEALGAINDAEIFYENESADLDYNVDVYFKRVVLNAAGNVIDAAASIVPLAFDEWINAGVPGSTEPKGPIFQNSIEGCDKDRNLMICGNKGFVISGSAQDMGSIDWCDFGHCSQLNAKSCLNETDIYFYSENNVSPSTRQLTRISRGTNGDYEDIFTNIETKLLACAEDGGILVKGYNLDTSGDETFHYKNAVKTMLTAPISDFIR